VTTKREPGAGLEEQVRAAAAGDRDAAEAVLEAVQGEIYRLGLRMLGHPADAEDATQEILVLVLTRLASFRGESAFRTWVFRIAVSHLLRFRRGRREEVSFEQLGERLDTGLRAGSQLPEAEVEVHAQEIRLRCTGAMLLCLDRELRVAWILGEIFGLSGDEAASVLEIAPAAFRKRLSRARTRLFDFMGGRCGLYDPQNPCRCSGQIDCAIERGLFQRGELLFARHPAGPPSPSALRGAREVAELYKVAEVLRGHPNYSAPAALTTRLRRLLSSDELELLRAAEPPSEHH
jgi:RNA polymerase sigma factor (sigma-70 family)